MRQLIASFLILGILALPAEARRRWVPPMVAASSTTTVGNTTIGGTTGNYLLGYVYGLAKFTAPQTGNITSIFLYGANSSGTASIKIGLYSQSGSGPDALISGSPVTVSTPGTWALQWKEFTGLSLPVVSGTVYWFAVSSSEDSVFSYYYDDNAVADLYYLSQSYATAWPNPYGTETGSLTRTVSIKATLTY